MTITVLQPGKSRFQHLIGTDRDEIVLHSITDACLLAIAGKRRGQVPLRKDADEPPIFDDWEILLKTSQHILHRFRQWIVGVQDVEVGNHCAHYWYAANG